MTTSKNKFTFKIILSYLALSTLFIMAGAFLFSEFENLSSGTDFEKEEKKIVETGTLISQVYKTDGYSRLALLTENEADYEQYIAKNDSLFEKIEALKAITTDEFQQKQLDSVKSLLKEKNNNIEQLRILRLTNRKETTLDDIMEEVRKLEASVGLTSVEAMVKEPSKLTPRERKIWQSYADYLNQNKTRDTAMVKSKVVDSMLMASRYIVAEAKKENSRIRSSLIQKENELIRNDLNISERLRTIITSFDKEITRKKDLEDQQKSASIRKTGQILKYSGILALILILIFSYIILSDFFKAERFKKNLEKSKSYTESLLKSREQLIYTVSHDLKTPLNSIQGYTELLRNSPVTAKQQQYLHQISSGSEFISRLVSDLLDYSKLEAGKLTIEKIPFSLSSVLTEVGKSVQELYAHKPIRLKIEIPPSVQEKIYEGDPLRLKQIIYNLTGNAFKFTKEGEVKIVVKPLGKVGQVENLSISVIDTGIGIPEEKLDLIFEEFTQADPAIAQNFGGSGLGLSISGKLIELMEGTISVTSELGKGSNFQLTIPLKILKSENRKTDQVIKTKQVSENLKLVIIEDDPALCRLLQEVLEQLGIEVRIFRSFENFKKEDLRKFRYHCIITDIQLQETNGFEILRTLQTENLKNYKNQPVVAMTGSRIYPDSYFYKKGFSALLKKPFSKDDLVQTLLLLFPDQHQLLEKNTVDFPGTVSSAGSVLDLRLLQSFVNSPEAVCKVLKNFETQTDTDMEVLRKAFEEGDKKTIKDTAHRMLTMFRQLQIQKAIPILEKLDASEENFDLLRREFTELLAIYSTVKEELLTMNYQKI